MGCEGTSTSLRKLDSKNVFGSRTNVGIFPIFDHTACAEENGLRRAGKNDVLTAVKRRDLEIVREQLKAAQLHGIDATKDLLAIADDDGNTLLHCCVLGILPSVESSHAAECDDGSLGRARDDGSLIVEVLVSAGANVNAENMSPTPPPAPQMRRSRSGLACMGECTVPAAP